MKIIVAILFVCLAMGANAGRLSKLNPFSSHAESDYDLEGLEKWLQKEAPEVDDKDIDLRLLKNNVGQFKSRKLENTVQLLLDMIELKECDQQVLVKLNELAKANVFWFGQKRTERILLAPVGALYESCGKYVDEKLGALSDSSLDDDQRQFIKMIHETDLWKVAGGYMKGLEFPANERCKEYDQRPSIWDMVFRRLSRDVEGADVKERVLNSKTKQYETIYHRDRFDHAINDYLMPSCESFMAVVGDKFDFAALEALISLRNMGSDPRASRAWPDFTKTRPDAVLHITSAHTFCSYAPQLRKDNFDSVFEMLKQNE